MVQGRWEYESDRRKGVGGKGQGSRNGTPRREDRGGVGSVEGQPEGGLYADRRGKKDWDQVHARQPDTERVGGEEGSPPGRSGAGRQDPDILRPGEVGR